MNNRCDSRYSKYDFRHTDMFGPLAQSADRGADNAMVVRQLDPHTEHSQFCFAVRRISGVTFFFNKLFLGRKCTVWLANIMIV